MTEPVNELVNVAPAFLDMAHRIVWAVAATADARGRPATRVLHPVWEWDGDQLRGWIATFPESPKAKHLATTPSMSLTYWASNHDTCTADCEATWEKTETQRIAAWHRFANAPEPVGYDPAIIPGWDSPTSATFGVLRLDPMRLRVMPGSLMTAGSGELLRWRR